MAPALTCYGWRGDDVDNSIQPSYGVSVETAAREITSDAQKIARNGLLYEIYCDVYRRMLAELPRASYPALLEIGSGGGFFRDLAPHVITSDCAFAPGVDRVVDACALRSAFQPASLDGIAMFNVFHHLPDVSAFLEEASIVLRPSGRIVMVEPWFTTVGQWFYRVLHHEPYAIDPDDWRIIGEGRLAGANTRLPTSVFRDSDRGFHASFPELRIVRRDPFHKGLYLASGGLRLNTRVPRRLARALCQIDGAFAWGNALFGLFALIVVDRR